VDRVFPFLDECHDVLFGHQGTRERFLEHIPVNTDTSDRLPRGGGFVVRVDEGRAEQVAYHLPADGRLLEIVFVRLFPLEGRQLHGEVFLLGVEFRQDAQPSRCEIGRPARRTGLEHPQSLPFGG